MTEEPREFAPVHMWHPDRPGTRRGGTPAQVVQLKADGWRERRPVALSAKTPKTRKKTRKKQ